jgi:hypothetical protein
MDLSKILGILWNTSRGIPVTQTDAVELTRLANALESLEYDVSKSKGADDDSSALYAFYNEVAS